MIIDDRVAIRGLTDEEPSLGHPPPVLSARQAESPRSMRVDAPDLVGLAAVEAHAAARSAGLRLSVSVWETTVGPWGMVVDQRPEAGTRVRRGGRLGVIVSGRSQVPVPDVKGLPLEAAIERLCWLGFVPLVEARSTSDSVLPGHIISTRPSAGALLSVGSVVSLTLARLPARRPSPVGLAQPSGK